MNVPLHALAVVAGVGLMAWVLWDGLGTIIVPRRLTSRFRLTRFFYFLAWPLWRWWARRLPAGGRREALLSWFGPGSLLALLAIWGMALIAGFAAVHWGLYSPWSGPGGMRGWSMDLYASGATFFTLGPGDLIPLNARARALVVAEGGMGIGFLAMVIGYMPVLYGAFSRRESEIVMLDARAGSPPSAGELLRRHGGDGAREELLQYLARWERWSAELLESHISYPTLGMFRSQHLNQSWLAALVTVLDSCAFLVATGPPECMRTAKLTFAMARHAMVDVGQIYIRRLDGSGRDRLPPADAARLVERLREAGWKVRWDAETQARLTQLRELYEPPALAVAERLVMTMPVWLGDLRSPDNWQRSPWRKAQTGIREEHF